VLSARTVWAIRLKKIILSVRTALAIHSKTNFKKKKLQIGIMETQLNLFTTAALGTEESGCCREV